MDRIQAAKIRDLLETKKQDLESVITDNAATLQEQLTQPSGEGVLDFNHPADAVSGAGDPDYEKQLKLIESRREELSMVEQALWRLGHSTFGYCEECKHEISFQRLLAVPYTRLCITCSRDQQKALAN